MASSNLVLHRGANEVSRQELAQFQAPPPEGRWFPLSHARVIDAVGCTLEAAGYRIAREKFGVSRGGHRLFATLDLATTLTTDGSISLAVGVRNSTDKSFPLGFVAGSRVFVCIFCR